MRSKTMGRVVRATAMSLALSLGVIACSNDYTVSYVYMTSSRNLPHGLINGYQVDYQNGYLRPLADSPVDSGGRNTVALALAPNNLALYTVNNFDSDVVQFNIGTDGKLYPQRTYDITGSLATAAAIDAAGKFLFVTFTYQNNPDGSQRYTPANPGPGGVTVFPIHADFTLGTPFTVNAGRNPIGVTAVTNAAGSYVYVIEQDGASSANLLGFQENTGTGALTPLPGVTINAGNIPSVGYPSGASPASVLSDKTGTHLYVTDSALNQIAAYTVNNGIPALSATVATDAQPMGMSFDLSGGYLYVAAYAANAVDRYTVGANGLPVRAVSSASVQTGIGPTCVSVSGAPSNANPSHAEYLYTSNQLSNNVSGEQVNQSDGSLVQIQGTPFNGSALPTCIVTAPAFPLR